MSSKSCTAKVDRLRNRLRSHVAPDNEPFYSRRNEKRVTRAHAWGMRVAAASGALPRDVIPHASATADQLLHDRVERMILRRTSVQSLQKDAAKLEKAGLELRLK